MPVFISHRKADTAAAVQVDNRLKHYQIQTYLDVLDPGLQKAENVTERFLSGLQRCTHLLAIISAETAGSWWVPFEIGVATDGDKRITSFSGVARSALPDYLVVWPVMTREDEIDAFARWYQRDRMILEKSYRLSEARTSPVQTAADFHRLLKRELGQG